MCQSLVMPLLAPGSIAEILSLGLHAVAMSRHAGLWTGLKIVADIADAFATVGAGAAHLQVPVLTIREREPPVLLPPSNLDAEHYLLTARLQLVHDYARAAGLNRVTFEPARPAVGHRRGGSGVATLGRDCYRACWTDLPRKKRVREDRGRFCGPGPSRPMMALGGRDQRAGATQLRC
jgi:indolepyruvate ferredoxin oxidoreductase